MWAAVTPNETLADVASNVIHKIYGPFSSEEEAGRFAAVLAWRERIENLPSIVEMHNIPTWWEKPDIDFLFRL